MRFTPTDPAGSAELRREPEQLVDDRLVWLSEDTHAADLSAVTTSSDPTQSTPHCDLWSAESKVCFSAQFAESIDSGDNERVGGEVKL